MPLSGRGGARATLDGQEKYTAAAVRSSGGLCLLPAVLPPTANDLLILALRLPANLRPVLFAHVVVDLDQARVESVSAAFFAPGDPILLAAIHVEVVRLEPPLAQALELPAAVVKRLARLGERHAANPRPTAQPVGLTFDIHDVRPHG